MNLLHRLKSRIAAQHSRQTLKRERELLTRQRSYPLVGGGLALMLVPSTADGPRPLSEKLTGPFTVTHLLEFKAVLRTGNGEMFERGLDQLTRYFTPHEALHFVRTPVSELPSSSSGA